MNVCYAFIHDLIHHDNQFHQIDYFNYDIEVFKGSTFYQVDLFHQDVHFIEVINFMALIDIHLLMKFMR